MKHFQISLLILNLIAGFGIILFVYNKYRKHRHRVLIHLLYYCISFNLLVFVDLNYKYTLSNIFDNQLFEIPAAITLLMLTLVFVAEFGITYYLYLTITRLKKKKVSKNTQYLFLAWFSFFAIISIAGIFIYFRSDEMSWFYIFHATWIFSMILIILTNLIALIIFSRNYPELSQKKGIKAFGFIFLVAYIGFTISQLDFYFFHVKIEDFDPLILLIINVCPLLWLHYYYLKYQESLENNDEYQFLMRKLIEVYNITIREKEIIELILEGKTNKEIENELFISFNTVKNHIYNIYQKTGVKSRMQLMQLIKQM